jgi:acyl carrier protein
MMGAKPTTDEIQQSVRSYLITEFLPGEDPAELTQDLPLISSKIIDSIAAIKLISFLEGQFGIQIEAHEVDIERLDTIARITLLVQSKQA